MRDYRSVLILLSLGLLAFGSAQETSPEEEEITDLSVRVVESWGQRPTALITSRSFADDLHLVDPRGRTLKGVDKIRQAYEQLLRQGLVAYSGETGHPFRGKWPPGRSEATLGIS